MSITRSSEPDASIRPSWLKLSVRTGQLWCQKRVKYRSHTHTHWKNAFFQNCLNFPLCHSENEILSLYLPTCILLGNLVPVWKRQYIPHRTSFWKVGRICIVSSEVKVLYVQRLTLVWRTSWHRPTHPGPTDWPGHQHCQLQNTCAKMSNRPSVTKCSSGFCWVGKSYFLNIRNLFYLTSIVSVSSEGFYQWKPPVHPPNSSII